MFVTPSLLGQIFSGLLVALALGYVIYYKVSPKPTDVVIILLLLAIAIGIHSLNHFTQEFYYKFDPFRKQYGEDPKGAVDVRLQQ